MFPQVAFSDLTYSVLRVDETYDGRSKGDDFTGAWIKIVNVKSNGSQHILPILQFEIAGNYGTTVDTLGFMSGKTVTKIDPKIASKVDEWGGKKHYRVYVYQSLEEGNLRRFLTSLKPEDQETIKAICGSLSDKEFVRGLIPKMISANRFGEKYKKYWSNKSRVIEIVSHAKECNRGLGQSNSNASKFVLVNKDEINKPELCGFSLHSDFKFGRAEKISAQSTLNELGHYQGSIDGDFGKNSCKALKSYLSSRLIQIDNNKILKSHIDPLINKAKKKISPPTIPLSTLARSEQYGVTNNETVDNSNGEEEIQKDVSAYNRLSLENASMLKAIGNKENLITQLQTQIKSIKKTVKSSQDESAGLKALTSEQKKLTEVLKERIIAIEAASILLKTVSLQAERKTLRQATKIDGLQATIIELKYNIVSLKKQKKSLEISELETSKQIEILRDDQATLQKTKEYLISSNEALILENGSLSTKLQKLGSKSLFEGGLSGNSQGSTNSKKDDLSLVSNSLGGNLISKQLIKNLQDENAEFRRAKIENLDKIEALKIQLQTAMIQLATTKSLINELKKEATKQSTKITNLQDELSESKTKTQSKVIELVSLKAQLAELQSYKTQMANKKSQEIETSKIALKALFENKKALILSSASGEAEVKDYISNLIERLGLSPEADTFDIFLASDKTFSITLGLGTQDECNSMRDQLLSFGSIPKDSFCGDWNEYIAAFDFKNGQLTATIGRNFHSESYLSNDPKIDKHGMSEPIQTQEELAKVVEPELVKKNVNLNSLFDSDLKKSLAVYYFTLPKIGSKEFLCEYEPGPTYIGNKKIWECQKNNKGYELNKNEETERLGAGQNIGYNKDGSVGFAYAYLEVSARAHTERWFKNMVDAEAFVESIYGKADKREQGKAGCFNLSYKSFECDYIALSYGCETYFFDKPGNLIKGGSPSTHRDILEEISPGPLGEKIKDKRLHHFSREIIKSEVINKETCRTATIASWKKEGQRMGEDDTTKVSVYVADMQTSFPALKGQW
jgi:hypothetical protein